MALSENDIAAIEDLVSRWYWQIQERGSWAYIWHEQSMVRYYECAPLEADWFDKVLEYLQNQTNITHLQLHGKDIELGVAWKASRAWYQTLEGDTSETNRLKRVRIYQALILNNEDEDGDGPYVVENGCAWKVSFTFFWKQAAAPDSLPASTSGVNYRYSSIMRDEETGLWSYILEKRERVQQDVAEYNRRNDYFEVLGVEQHLGVKEGTELEGYKARAGVAADGTVTEVEVRKNEDCTSDVTITKLKRNSAVTVKTCAQDLFRHEHAVTSTGESSPEDADVDPPGDGVTHERRVEYQNDGKCTVTERTTTELGVEDAETVVEQNLFETVEEVEDRNQDAVTGEPQAEGGSGGEVVRKSIVKTPGDLRTKRTRTVTEREVEDAEKVVTQDLYQTVTETEDRNKAATSGEPQAEGGSGGKVVRKSVAKTPGGLRNKRKVETQERGVTDAEKTVSETAFETITETADRNQQSAATQTGLADGVRVGDRKTPGGLHDHTTRTVTEKSDVAAGSINKKDLYGTDVGATTRGVASDSGSSDVSTGGTGGKSIRADYRKTETGKFVKELVTHTESKVADAKKLDTGDAVSTTTESQTFADAPASVPSVTAFTQGTISTLRTEKTPGGLVTHVATSEVATAAETKTLKWYDDGGSYVLELYWNARALPTISSEPYVGRRVVQPHFNRNRFGCYDGYILYHYMPATTWKGSHKQWWPGDFQETGLTRKYVSMVRYDDQWYKRVKTVTYTYGYNDDIQNGDSTTDNKGLEDFVSGGLEGSQVKPYGPGAYYWKVTNIAIVDTAVASPVNTSEAAS